MTKQEFSTFSRLVEKADANDFIWWQGYYWIDLTPRQAGKIDLILRGKGFVDTVTDIKGRKAHRLPSGLTLAYTA